MVAYSVVRVVFLALGLALELYVLAFMPLMRVDANGGHRVALSEFGNGVPVIQAFRVRNNGLRAVRIQLSSADTVDVDVEYSLTAASDRGRTEWFRSSRTISSLRGARWETFEFPAIEASAGRDYAFEVRVRNVRPQQPGAPPSLALAASRDRPLRHSYLLVGDQERWGSLLFDTRAAEDTWLGRVRHKVLPNLPPVLRHMSLVYVLLVIYNAVFAGWLLTRGVDAVVPDLVRLKPDATTAGDRLLRLVIPALVLAAAGGMVVVARADGGRISLIERLYEADLQSSIPLHAAFDVFEKEIGPERRPVIFAHTTSRITWRLNIPPRARFRTEIALDPDAWGTDNDGVVFRIAVAEPSTPLEPGGSIPLFMRHVNARHIAADQRWIPVEIDLRGFAGKTIDLILMTEPSLPGYLPSSAFDWALWAAPRIQ